MGEARKTEIGDRVRFAVGDIFLPGPGGGSLVPSEVSELDGTVIEFSDSGFKTRAFAVVEVVRKHLMVVPVEKLESVASPEGPAMNEERG